MAVDARVEALAELVVTNGHFRFKRDSEQYNSTLHDIIAAMPHIDISTELRAQMIDSQCDETMLPCDHTTR